ncbi:UDP-glycosyltransferase 76B1-like [Rhodamnia argentea]|uniref:UDP-glycosyltransferase 76B1-like n=1 Tax=Rhodamnia argentea TaxID=178133 RepID=A0A8B8NW07_9MYRT|nr:UDP-glycosyltransferase 76B1-like [Rhodamnia argentea]
MEDQRVTPAKPRSGSEIILFPLPLQGHITPMLQLGNILYSRGFSITIVHTHFNSPKSSNYPHFDFRPIPNGFLEGQASTVDFIALVTLMNVTCVGPFRDCLAKLLSDASEDRISCCLITDPVWHFTQAVADELRVPRMVLRTSSISSFLAFCALPLMREKGYLPLQDSRLEDAVPELPPLKVKDLHVINTKDPEDVLRLIVAMAETIQASSGLIFNSFEELEPAKLAECRRRFSVPIFTVGPFHKQSVEPSSSLLPQDRSSIPWLDKQEKPKSVLYVSFGSLSIVSEAQFLEIAWGLANSGRHFLWVVRPGSVRGSEWLEALPSGFLEGLDGRGHIVRWAPQHEVLAHPTVGGFWTHNGWNSTLEAVCEGVPMMCMPFFGDQRVNARYVRDEWRVGLHLEYKVERREIEDAIRRLMGGEERKEMRERMKALKRKVDECLKEGGSSYRSLQELTEYLASF